MDPVFLLAQEYSLSLQPTNPRRRLTHMSPLVELVCGKGTGAGGDEEHCSDSPEITVQRHQKSTQQEWESDERDIATRIDEVSLQEVVRVDVVEAEGAEKARAKYRDGFASPSVCNPVNNATGEVREEHRSQKRDGRPPGEEPGARGEP